jgi:hypothetical protein
MALWHSTRSFRGEAGNYQELIARMAETALPRTCVPAGLTELRHDA